MKNVLVTLGLVVALFATACKSDSSDNNNPTSPQTSATNSFTANGGGYSNTVFKGFNVDSAGIATVEGSDGLVVFSGLTGKNNESFVLTLMVKDVKPGSYTVNATEGNAMSLTIANSGSSAVSYFGVSGTITITEWGAIGSNCKGTFTGQLTAPPSLTMNITDGKFNVKHIATN
ncbi:MAG: hypothetical protein J0I17_08885 ['Candidatus Kapabacteria' thiocyanatum]|uniref:CBM6 domain-containing protein n=1 Tax=Candidatus Kapaibacterium thiocyanatum TaxID=1895771 RepID=A0A1M3KZ39_9BACT|nr:hypothetical protein ['Candidatus Kapabacteria' thiocyanatum]OJX57774.1 MAG: hypothetical protein BGO89_07330 ['Candidatus Kapabacteria' thiocyanatum]